MDKEKEVVEEKKRHKWYAVRTYSGHEKRVKEALEHEIEHAGVGHKIKQILVPSENVVEMRNGKKRIRNRVFFPGYILIEMDMDKETKYLVENTMGIISFIGPQNKPQPLREEEVKRILGEVDEKRGKTSTAAPFRVGDPIKVIDGPFNDFSGFVQEINQEKQKVKVMVSIFGRATPVELDFLQVELEK